MVTKVPIYSVFFIGYNFLNFWGLIIAFLFAVRRNNWPPLPENNCCGLQPCFYQDINVEIPPEFQPVVRNLYYLWMCKYLLLTPLPTGEKSVIFEVTLFIWKFVPLSLIVSFFCFI